MPHRGFTAAILIVIVALLVAGGIVGYIAQGKKTGPSKQSPAQTAGSDINQTTYAIDPSGSAQLDYWNSDGSLGAAFYTFPPALWQQLNEQLGASAQIGNAVQVPNKPNEYYLSVTTTHTDGRPCFVIANKIYLLDTKLNTVSLYYNQPSSTLPEADYRACDKDLRLVGTQGTRLILQYHPIGRGGVCDQTWAYPEMIWYLDSTNPSETKKFSVPQDLYQKALKDVATCQKSMGV